MWKDGSFESILKSIPSPISSFGFWILDFLTVYYKFAFSSFIIKLKIYKIIEHTAYPIRKYLTDNIGWGLSTPNIYIKIKIINVFK